jgi:putative transposase
MLASVGGRSDVSKLYDTDLDDAAWVIVERELPAALPGGRPRTTNLRAVVNAIFYLLRTGCQWRLLPRGYPPCSTVYHYFSVWRTQGVLTRLQWILHRRVRLAAGRRECPTVVIMDGQSVKTTERGGMPGFDGHKRVKGRKRHILVDTLGLPIASSVEPANISDRKAGPRLLGGLRFAFPNIRIVVADAGHESRKLARELRRHDGYKLQIVKRKHRAFVALTVIVQHGFQENGHFWCTENSQH